MPKACQATSTYLLFFPDDETMLENKVFYETLDGFDKEDAFRARPEAVQYLERAKGEKSLLDYIEKNFQFDEGDISEASGVVVAADDNETANEIPST